MNNYSSIFFSYRLKIVGALLLGWAFISFYIKYNRHAIWDYELLAGLACWGMSFIFFSREKIDDERIHQLKFRALAWGVPVGLFLTHLINYFFFRPEEAGSGKSLPSISAYYSIGLILVIANCLYYYFKIKENRR